MEYIITCTAEELALMVTVCGYPGVAKGIAEASLGEKTPQEWEAIMGTAARQLILKQVWDSEKERRDEVPFSEEAQQFIREYVESKWMIRCVHQTGANILMIHHVGQDKWMSHVIDQDMFHEFSYINEEEIPEIIRSYYSFSDAPSEKSASFQLTDKMFDLLSKPDKTEKVRKKNRFAPEEEQSFDHFITDLEKNSWLLMNISFFNIPSMEADPILENIVFFLPSDAGIWIVEYTEDRKTPVHIELNTHEEWCGLLNGVGTVAAMVNQG
ncbi:hypothetical protein [Neobacillus mesonae]|uniref:hypothetical protein n=1 Tax=Neobacillus mesonae TaxID=1193713 RepID=UPI00203DBC7B|nr:hypothetical protein [Neobacillus mesonae]MCM3567290.1 hypothetical protein [Neobacillus mesonae]